MVSYLSHHDGELLIPPRGYEEDSGVLTHMVTRAGMDMSDTHWACHHTDTGVGVTARRCRWQVHGVMRT